MPLPELPALASRQADADVPPDWPVFRADALGVSVRYPSTWYLDEDPLFS
jgi:hypothetical protein